jgi:hypothetical protein
MSIQNGKFGVELEMTGITRDGAANLLKEYFSNKYSSNFYVDYECHLHTWFVRDNKNRKWSFAYDSSIYSGSLGDCYKCEMVTPILDYEDIEMLQEIVRLLRKNGARVNDSCGLHIHVDASEFNAQSLKNLVNTFAMREQVIYKALGTKQSRINRWCRKVDRRFLNRMENSSKTFEEIKTAWYGDCSAYHSHYDITRYAALNLHSLWEGKGIEFRMFEATMHAGEIKAYIQFALALCSRACEMRCARKQQMTLQDAEHSFEDWLYRLGLRGEEFSVCRFHLMKRIDGRTWKNENVA